PGGLIPGRSSNGEITAPRRSNLIRKLYRFLDSKRSQFPGSRAVIARLDYDPNRNCKISLVVFTEGCLAYVLAAEANRKGDNLINMTESNEPSPGDSLKLARVSSGSLVYNLSTAPGNPGQYIRAAGSAAILVKTNKAVSLLKLKSGEYRYFFSDTLAVLGKVNSSDYFLKSWRLAGKARRLGFRPRTRALVKNPVDHPMGGRTKGGTPKLTPKGKICLNTETKITRNKLVVIKAREKKKI
ncbi:hypothetical protein EON73_05935, partial [bacterium]